MYDQVYIKCLIWMYSRNLHKVSLLKWRFNFRKNCAKVYTEHLSNEIQSIRKGKSIELFAVSIQKSTI